MQPDDFLPLSHDEQMSLALPQIGEKTQADRSSYRDIIIGSALLLLLVGFAFLVPLFSPYTYEGCCLVDKNLSPCSVHIFGTDDLGRDLATRVAFGLRISLSIAIVAALLDLFIGLSWGSISGYIGGLTDLLMMRIADFIYSIPYLLSVILVAAIIGPGISSILVAMCFIGWIQMARLSRTQVLGVKEQDYITAARAVGVSNFGIITRHILPNISGPILAMLMLTVPNAIFAESFLSFLGIGIQPPLASLGSMISDGLPALRFYPWRLFIPAVFVTFTILAFNLVGDGLRDLLDPKQQKLVQGSYAS